MHRWMPRLSNGAFCTSHYLLPPLRCCSTFTGRSMEEALWGFIQQQLGTLDVQQRLLMAAELGDVQMLMACLAEGADPNQAAGALNWKPLHMAAAQGNADCLQALTAAGADVNATNEGGCTALHAAAMHGQVASIEMLLFAGANPMLTSPRNGTPLHWAADAGYTEAARQLIAAAPQAATTYDCAGSTPVAGAVHGGFFDTALILLQEGPLQPAGELLAALSSVPVEHQPQLHPHFAAIASRLPLTAQQWELVPQPCGALVAALPSVMVRSVDEAALLVRHLLPEQRERLRTAALALVHAQRRCQLSLPTSVVCSILALCCA